MAVQKKRKQKKTSNRCRNLQVFKWTSERKKAAFLLSLGTYTIEAAAKELNVSERVIYNWKEYPAFQTEIERHILKNENFTRAGLLRNCLKGLSLKESNISDDKNTYLDYIKEIADLQGLTKQKIEFDNVTSNPIPRTPAVIDAEYELLKAMEKASKEPKSDEQP